MRLSGGSVFILAFTAARGRRNSAASLFLLKWRFSNPGTCLYLLQPLGGVVIQRRPHFFRLIERDNMTQDAQATQTDGQPFRRLNIVPTRICKDCEHAGPRLHWCMAGDIKTCTVTGDRRYETPCAEKNADGECVSFEPLDQERIAAEEARAAAKLRREDILMAQCFLTAVVVVVLLFWILMP